MLSTLSILSLSAVSCGIIGRVELAPLATSAEIVGRLPNGNWEVSPAFVANYTLLLAQRQQLILECKRYGIKVTEVVK